MRRAADEGRAGGRIGLDTEFLREKTYRARLCLVQIATDGAVYLFDPLADYDIEPIAELVADSNIEVIVHAGRQDFEIFRERFGVLPRNVFDVQLAAGFAGYGGSLPYGRLVQATTKVELTKGESYTDWCRRPLTDLQLRYAADDVRYLLVIADKLKERLARDRRLDWVADEMHLLEDPALYEIDVEAAWRRVSGRGSLSSKQLGVLKELAAWREEQAAARDLPRGWVIKDQTLIEIARRRPGSIADLKAIRGFPPKEADRTGRGILELVERGAAAPVPETVSAPGRSAQTRARMLAGLADAVVRSRCEAAGVATELVATRGELEALLAAIFSGRDGDREHRLLRGWRRELAGSAVVDLARGRIAVRSSDRPPYIEEVRLNASDRRNEEIGR